MLSQPKLLTRAQETDIDSLGALAEYYIDGLDDYYTKEGYTSAWQGKGAADLGLSGPVFADRFQDLLESRIAPAGPRMRGGVPGDANERLGIDIVISPPKSVSIQALIGGDTEVIRAHDAAVARTVEVMESFADTRIKENRKSRTVLTGNLVVAAFRHETSRENDPQLHTHAIIMNITKAPDGKWRSLRNDRIFDQQFFFTEVYRAELAQSLAKLGFQIRHGKDGAFELAHVGKAQIDAFSSRATAIVNELETKGLSRDTASVDEKQRIALQTRPRKTVAERDLLHAKWRDLAHDLGIRFDGRGWSGPGAGRETGAREAAPASRVARNAVRYAISHLTERQSIMSAGDLAITALRQAQGHARLVDVHAEIATQIRTGFLIPETPLYRPAAEKDRDAPGRSRVTWAADLVNLGLDRKDAQTRVDDAIRNGGLISVEGRYTTQTALEREKRILAIERDGRGAVAPILDAAAARARFAPASLDKGQREAAELILSTPNRVVGVQGLAGTGKSHMLRTAKSAIEDAGHEVRALASYGSQVKNLRELNVASNTLAAFLRGKEKDIGPKTVLVVDEAGVVPTRLMERVLKLAEQKGARVVLVGDTAQTKAIEAGRPFDQLQAAGMMTAHMTEIRRQRNAELKAAVELAAKGLPKASLERIPDVVEIKEPHERRAAVAKAFITLNPKERDRTLIVSGTNEARREINAQVRDGLGLAGNGIEFATLVRRDTTQAERKHSRTYHVGDLIQPEKDYPKQGLTRGEAYQVLDTGPGNLLTVRAEKNGAVLSFNPARAQKLSVYEPRRAELTPGDVVRVTRNDAALDLANGDRFKVERVETGRVTLANGARRVELPTAKPLHLDHAYATTVHSAQGLTSDRVLIDADSKSRTTTKEVYYVAISRPRDGAAIFTDDKSKLPHAITRATEKSAALDLTLEKGTTPRAQPGAGARERNGASEGIGSKPHERTGRDMALAEHANGDRQAARYPDHARNQDRGLQANAAARQHEKQEREAER